MTPLETTSHTSTPTQHSVSLFETCKSNSPSGTLTLDEFTSGIRDGRWRAEVEQCRSARQNNGEAAYKAAKNSLPCVTLSGTMRTKAAGHTLDARGFRHSGLLQLDFDRKDHPGKTVEEIRKIVADAPFVVAVALSPSGDGVKGIALCPPDPDTHRGSWQAAADYFIAQGLALDPSTKDVCRLCFVTYDPNMFTRPVGKGVPLVPVDVPELPNDNSRNARGTVNLTFAREVVRELAEKLGRPNRVAWLHITSAVCDGVGPVEGITLMEEFFPEEKEHEYETLIRTLKTFAAWGSLRKYGVDPDDPTAALEGLPDCNDGPDVPEAQEGTAKVKELPQIVWGVNGYPSEPDPETVLLGNDWLRQGDLATLISSAGAGKSVGITQAAMAWALCLPYFGITPTRPLRVLLFSGEDDHATIGQIREGFLENSEALTGTRLTRANLSQLDSTFRIDFSRSHVGNAFHTHLDRLLKESPADLVIINPLMAYIGGEVVATAPTWLRTGLLPLLQKHRCGGFCAHHTTKLNKDSWDIMDDVYSGIGGAEMANTPRSVITMRPTKADGLWVLRVGKRQTTGWRNDDGELSKSHHVRRTSRPDRPAWLPVGHGEAAAMISASGTSTGPKGGRKPKVTVENVVFALDTGGGEMSRQELIKSLMDGPPACSERTAEGAIKAAEDEGLIHTTKQGNPKGGKALVFYHLPKGDEPKAA